MDDSDNTPNEILNADINANIDEKRRRFLAKVGRFALATPPAVALLLTSGGATPAWASGCATGGQGGKGDGGYQGQGGNNLFNEIF